MRNSEYMAVLAEAVEYVREVMADRRLPDLNPEHMAWWFKPYNCFGREGSHEPEGNPREG